MKFQPDTLPGVNAVSRIEPQRLWVGTTPFTHSIVVPWRGEVLDWSVGSFDTLGVAHFERLLALNPEVVIFGSGARLRFAPPMLLRGLIARRIGVESMDTGAAARTYNVLASEGRSVVGAFLLESVPPTVAP
jgi:uncharacterized protein